ncbi:hypothetical protein A0H76_2284 [Hepatospora eriocheir]|uniref:Uncharacterized protein n=1 Tax=Hepatospora eriocheir TaxID=1081669 RepID=A0A1X0QFM8_9MICR|nr:hypothetical protein A0H76_2284 [Hepatospora eriocheir]
MHNINRLHQMNTKCFLIELEKFIITLNVEKTILKKVKDVLIKADITFAMFLTGVKLYKEVIKKRREFIKKYDLTRIGLKEFNDKRPEIITNRIVRDYSYEEDKIVFYTDNISEIKLVKKLLNDEYLIIITCFMMSCKIYHDLGFTNECWQNVSKINCIDLNITEILIFELVNHNLYIPGEESIFNEIIDVLNVKETSFTKFKKGFKSMFCFN